LPAAALLKDPAITVAGGVARAVAGAILSAEEEMERTFLF
jgi:hypothetical protein